MIKAIELPENDLQLLAVELENRRLNMLQTYGGLTELKQQRPGVTNEYDDICEAHHLLAQGDHVEVGIDTRKGVYCCTDNALAHDIIIPQDCVEKIPSVKAAVDELVKQLEAEKKASEAAAEAEAEAAEPEPEVITD